jgi:hypothetical protein
MPWEYLPDDPYDPFANILFGSLNALKFTAGPAGSESGE